MVKPVINLDELEFKSHENGPFGGSYGPISERIGAQRLGYNLTICPPGKKICPFHNHRAGEEMFFILEGEGVLRFGDREYPLRPHDVIACPPGDRSVAHQIVNTGTRPLKYLALGTKDRVDVCEYPDSDKMLAFSREPGETPMRYVFQAKDGVDYFKGET